MIHKAVTSGYIVDSPEDEPTKTLRDVAVDVLKAHALLGNRHKECGCGWHQNSHGATELNHPHHVAHMLWRAGIFAGPTASTD